MSNAKFKGFQRPNSTDTPDEWYLQVAPHIRHLSEMKVMLYIIYRTFGWRKWDDWISLSQFENGQHGRPDDIGCGLSHAAVLEGLEHALGDGYVRCRLLCPHCGEEVERTETEQRPWRNRHGAGVKDIPVVAEFCPHCGKTLRTLERPYYRLAFADEVVDAYAKPQDWLAKYQKDQVENPSLSQTDQVENSSPQVENPSSPPEKLEFSTSHSPSHSPSQSTDDHDGATVTTLIERTALKRKSACAIIDRYGEEGALRWLAYVLDKGVDNPAGYLVTCCLRNRDPPPAYTGEQVERILAGACQVPVNEPTEQAKPTDLDRTWQRCLSELQMQTTANVYARWYANTRLLSLQDGIATLAVRDEYAVEWIESRLAPQVAAILGPMTGLDPGALVLRCTVAESPARSPPPRPPPAERVNAAPLEVRL